MIPSAWLFRPMVKKQFTLHNGVFSIIDIQTLNAIRVPSYDNKIKSPLSKGSFLGIAFSKDSKTVYMSGGDNGAVIVYNIETLNRLDSITLNGTVDGIPYGDSFTSDLVLNEANNELLVLDPGQFQDGTDQFGYQKDYCLHQSGASAFWRDPEPRQKDRPCCQCGNVRISADNRRYSSEL